METFSALLALCAGNSPVTGEFPIQRPVTGSFNAFFELHLNNREAGDLRRHRAHYDVILMVQWGSAVVYENSCRNPVDTGWYKAE